MLLTKSDIRGRWAEKEILAVWREGNDESFPVWETVDGSQLCCDCASDFDAERSSEADRTGYSPEGLVEVNVTDPRVGCDYCETVIYFD